MLSVTSRSACRAMACTTCGAFRQRVRLLAPEVRDQIGGVLYELGLGKAGCHSGTGRRNRGSKLKPSCTAQLQKYIAQPRQSTTLSTLDTTATRMHLAAYLTITSRR